MHFVRGNKPPVGLVPSEAEVRSYRGRVLAPVAVSLGPAGVKPTEAGFVVCKKSEQTKGLLASVIVRVVFEPTIYSSMLTVSPPSRVTKAAKTFVEIVAGKKITEPSPRRPWTPLPWNE